MRCKIYKIIILALIQFILCIWGALFTDTWIRENSRLAFEWDVLVYENEEQDLPEYTRRNKARKEQLKEKSNFIKYIWSYEQYQLM